MLFRSIKQSILDRLVAYGCEVTVLPASASISDVLDLSPEGVFLSNGPGDPSAVDKLKEELEHV